MPAETKTARPEIESSGITLPKARLTLTVRGAVQGVGFRPFVHRLASTLQLAGWVRNSPQGVFIEVEGARPQAECFLRRLVAEQPFPSSIQNLESAWCDAAGYDSFEIRESIHTGAKTALVLPDLATCPECLKEVFDPSNRRYQYPFTNCAHCGPRFSIIEALPYDRPNTSMRSFAMCPACLAEYSDPNDRRFHAQPNACPACGPRLQFVSNRGGATARDHEALLAAAQALRRGEIVAVKGVGGFHLMADARDETAVCRLRTRKHREEKPFAVMFHSLDLAKQHCVVSELEQDILLSRESPIVLLRRKEGEQSGIAASVAPGNPNLGIMLPYAPLHHLLMAELNFPVVATSGNLSDEPICIENHEALSRLGNIADFFLVHDRPIVRHVDDSVVRIVLGRETILRRARGYAPLPLRLHSSSDMEQSTILAVGADLKNSVALCVGDQAFISQHIGDLATTEANEAFRRVIADFERLYDSAPQQFVADMHPGYHSVKFAEPKNALRVQHHVAHVLSCMEDNELQPPVLGVAWDGTGFGPDGTIWGGEFFLVKDSGVERMANLRTFRLPGGEAAVKEPRRAALGLLHEMFGAEFSKLKDLPPVAAFVDRQLAVVDGMLRQNVNSPRCSSIGRLFDAVAALIGLRQVSNFEGQAAMELEFALADGDSDNFYRLPITSQEGRLILDWRPLIEDILADLRRGAPVGEISACFHNALAEAIVGVARRAGERQVVLSGGCFQNAYLTERAVSRLREEGFLPYWHHRVPPNDGGIALGQIAAVRRRLALIRF